MGQFPVTEVAFSQPTRQLRNQPHVTAGRYRADIPGTPGWRSYTRVSTFAKTLSDQYNLTQWQIRMAIKGILERPDLATLAQTIDHDKPEGKRELNDVGKQAIEAAKGSAGANLGTAFHTVTEYIETGQMERVPEGLRQEADAYLVRMIAADVRPYLMERHIYCAELGLIGRFDRLYWMGDLLGIADAKTARHIEYGWLDIAIQLAVYAHADWIFDPDQDAWIEAPPIRHDIALVQSSKIGVGQCDLWAVDIEAGWQLAKLAAAVRDARAGKAGLASLLDAAEPAPAASLEYAVATAATPGRLDALWRWGQVHSLWTRAVDEAAHRRYAELTT